MDLKALLPLTLLLTSFVHAQEKSESGYLLNWTDQIKVERSTLKNGKYTLPAFTFTVFEADANAAAGEWTSAYRAMGGKVSGSSPYKGTGASVDGVKGPVTMMTNITRNKKNGSALVEVALAANDTAPAPNWEKGEKAVYDMAVRMNKGVVQKQIDEQQKLVDGLAKELASLQKDHAKTTEKSAKATSDMEKAKSEKAALSKKRTDLESEQLKLQARYPRTQDPKDLTRLHKVQKELVAVQKDLSKQLQKEAAAQKATNKKQSALPGSVENQQQLQAKKDKAVSELEALKRKKEAVK